MKKLSLIFILAFGILAQAQVNRFFYELSFKPKKDSAKIEKGMMVLDISPEKSLYRDYLMVSQDSIIQDAVEKMRRSGTFHDISKMVKSPKFAHKITKIYPISEVIYGERILRDDISYKDKVNFDWKITNESSKIGAYEVQKATTDFAGRKWTAWFSTDLPFQDGPYKFYGLPGLIVKIEDEGKNYSWVLQGNKKLTELVEETYSEKIGKQMGQGGSKLEVSRAKFDEMYAAYKKDPFASMRPQLAQMPANFKLPDGTTLSERIKQEEIRLKEFLNRNDNAIELKK